MNTDVVLQQFNQWSPAYDNDARGRGHYQAHIKVAEYIRRWTANINPATATIGDLGVGTGLVLEELRQHFASARMVGYDLSAGMLKKCAEKDIADDLVECNLEEQTWPIRELSFDIVTSAGLLDFISNTDNFLLNTHAIMKPGAVAALTYELQRFRGKGPGFVSTSNGHYPKEMHDLAARSGFDVIDGETFRGYAYYGNEVAYGLMVLQKPGPSVR